jgi:hypothetical protein
VIGTDQVIWVVAPLDLAQQGERLGRVLEMRPFAELVNARGQLRSWLASPVAAI